MGWVRGKLGGPYALFVHHSGQRHIDGSHARKFSPLRRSLNCSLAPPNEAWRESFSTVRLRNDSKRRFANSSCTVCTHTVSFVFSNLRRSNLCQITSFAKVHQKCTKNSFLAQTAPATTGLTRERQHHATFELVVWAGGIAATLSSVSYGPIRIQAWPPTRASPL